MNCTLTEGIISGLDRTTHVSGGGNTTATTTHISIFSLLGERVLLRTKYPAMIADGDYLKLVGIRSQGQFTAIACKNITTGWTSTFRRQGCMIAVLSTFVLFGLGISYFFPLFVIVPVIFGVIIFSMMKADAETKSAHMMLDQ
jgi:hypothetical protein